MGVRVKPSIFVGRFIVLAFAFFCLIAVVNIFPLSKVMTVQAAVGRIAPRNPQTINMGENTPKQNSTQTTVGSDFIGNKFELADLRNLYLAPIDKQKIWAMVRKKARSQQKRVLVTGGAGFVGSHLVDRLMLMGEYVICIDNYFTGRRSNVEHWEGHPNFELVRHDVEYEYTAEVDQIYHLACPASPPHYQYNPIKTLKTSSLGTINMLELAKKVKARFLLTSTSEVYGDPEVHPQKEEYWGHVNPIGPRACYDEGKRVAETLTYAYHRHDNVDVRVARIFNTFGPRMNENDGRVVSNFILQALKNEPITIYGSGTQTRSFQYVHDLVDGLMALMNNEFKLPVNLGNPDEYTIAQFAEYIRNEINKNSIIKNLNATEDDPQRRQPDITRAKNEIHWQPAFTVKQGIQETVEYFKINLPSL
ncbi:NAD(P)-binding protein [Rozella allomycis CSF55]|uniref:UDP-glucuronate decarboxylase n=1 Tax=Rozella allomycis (strain CSF55) TaxID=988480 RepID=A0A075APG4_ROZAC|nr:UDP-glucuronic acid decarboxylase 1 [Rozella allomycis CSF55]RKP22016.1 NAD(P)-binding protein [Rozella allomycis CSF55]|eukprot:EPZ31981.1 UDP-glucuronic acid decarboxylase 1 [Rozella allomycis CSF55]